MVTLREEDEALLGGELRERTSLRRLDLSPRRAVHLNRDNGRTRGGRARDLQLVDPWRENVEPVPQPLPLHDVGHCVPAAAERGDVDTVLAIGTALVSRSRVVVPDPFTARRVVLCLYQPGHRVARPRRRGRGGSPGLRRRRLWSGRAARGAEHRDEGGMPLRGHLLLAGGPGVNAVVLVVVHPKVARVLVDDRNRRRGRRKAGCKRRERLVVGYQTGVGVPEAVTGRDDLGHQDPDLRVLLPEEPDDRLDVRESGRHRHLLDHVVGPDVHQHDIRDGGRCEPGLQGG